MHPHRNAPAALLLLPCILLAATPAHEWRADLATREVANLYPRHGETAAIRCTLTRAGAPYVPESVSASVSTNGVWGDGWPAPATFASNVVVVSWSPELDPGAETLCLRIHVDGIHRPSAMLHLGPGGGGSTLPPPGTVIDFAETRYVNEPWATRTELRDATNALVIAAVDLSPYATWHGLDSATNALRQGVDADLGGYAAYGENGGLHANAYYVPWGAAGSIRFDGETVHFQHPGIHGTTGTDSLVRIPLGAGVPATNTLATAEGVAVAIATATNGLLSADDSYGIRTDKNSELAGMWLELEDVAGSFDLDAYTDYEGGCLYIVSRVDDARGLPPGKVKVPRSVGTLALTEDLAGYATTGQVSAAIATATNGLISAETELEAIRAAADEIVLPEDPTAAELGAAFRDLLMCIKNPQRARATLRATRGDAR